MKYNPKKDPYRQQTSEQQDTTDIDDLLIKPTDLIVLAGVSEDEEVSHLDVYVYESAEVSWPII